MDITAVTGGLFRSPEPPLTVVPQKARRSSEDSLSSSLSPSHSEGVLPDTGWPCVPRTGLIEALISYLTVPHSLCQDLDLLAAKARPPDQVVSSSVFLGAAPPLPLTILPALGRQDEL